MSTSEEIISPRAFLAYYYEGRRDFSNVQFCEGTELHRFRDLRNVKFDGAVIKNVLFHNCDLESVSFVGADLALTNFYQCRLIDVDFRDAVIAGTSFYTSTLMNVSVEQARNFRIPGVEATPERLRQVVADIIENEPGRWDQHTFGALGECGTPCCVAGLVVRAAGLDFKVIDIPIEAFRLLWRDGAQMPSFHSGATRDAILTALRSCLNG